MGVKTFTSNGTFTVPEGVTKIIVTACAGGQAGYLGTRSVNSSYRYSGGRGGNGGDCIVKKAFEVTPYKSIQITVGKGGTTAGTPGTATVIGNLITLAGGNGNNNGKNNGGCSGGRGGYDSSTGVFPENGMDGIQGSGGATSSNTGEIRDDESDGGGGGGSLGNGGNGVIYTGEENNVGINGSLGGGGGGAYCPGSIFGKGGDGIVIIER